MEVIATDSAPDAYRLTGTASVEIEIADEIDEAPEITVLLLQPDRPPAASRFVLSTHETDSSGGGFARSSGPSGSGVDTTSLHPGPPTRAGSKRGHKADEQSLMVYILENPVAGMPIAYVQVSVSPPPLSTVPNSFVLGPKW
ncbi:unnamed protein product [Protopolystoma xenopodis]|uniref:Cadherin domain-containing protein n=1 Tax=Protopolystoma xenopodis TaxID=117903 RepID=A0A448WP69_9PLAT|nr:unnamed protein product [Protopolystoma xenopodis]